MKVFTPTSHLTIVLNHWRPFRLSGFYSMGGLLSRQQGCVLGWYLDGAYHLTVPIPGENIVVLQADEKATISKIAEVFLLLFDSLQAAGAVGAQMQEEAGPTLERVQRR